MTTARQFIGTSVQPWHFLFLSLVLHAAVLLSLRFMPAPRVSDPAQTVLSVTLSFAQEPQHKPTHVAATHERPRAHVADVAPRTARASLPAVSTAANSMMDSGAAAMEESTEAQSNTAIDAQASALARRRSGLQGILLRDLRRYFEYPMLAKKLEWQGIVWLSVIVRPDGALDAVHLEESSGHELLDRAALNATRRIGRVIDAGAWLQGEALELPLPVAYQLID